MIRQGLEGEGIQQERGSESERRDTVGRQAGDDADDRQEGGGQKGGEESG